MTHINSHNGDNEMETTAQVKWIKNGEVIGWDEVIVRSLSDCQDIKFVACEYDCDEISVCCIDFDYSVSFN